MIMIIIPVKVQPVYPITGDQHMMVQNQMYTSAHLQLMIDHVIEHTCVTMYFNSVNQYCL